MSLTTFQPGDKASRKTVFSKMVQQATKYRHPDEDLQGKTILNVCHELKCSEFSSTVKAMVKLLRLYEDYNEPDQPETLQTASLKVTNKLISCIADETFAAVKKRAKELKLPLVTTRVLPPPRGRDRPFGRRGSPAVDRHDVHYAPLGAAGR